MSKMAKFQIVTCCGDHVKYVDVDIRAEDVDCDVNDFKYEYTFEALCIANITNYVCESCYNQAYRVEFAEWVEVADCAD